MRTIKLTNSTRRAMVSDDDYALASKSSWLLMSTGYVGYFFYNGSQRTCRYLHRVITKAPKGRSVHHRNHNPLDNTRANLCICSHAQNISHQRVQRNKKSGIKFKGVTRQTLAPHTFKVAIEVRTKRINLGTYRSQIEAAKAYDRAAIRYFGEFALTNKSAGLL